MRQVKQNFFVHILIISSAIVTAYYGLWHAYFFSDDYWMLGWVRHQESLTDAIVAQFGYGVRFLLDAVLWTRVQLFDLNAAPYYWSSLAQHIIVALMVYGLSLFWIQRRAAALLAALLFGTTFAHYEVVTWITGSEYSFAAILYLATLGQFALYLRQRHRLWYFGSLISFILLMLFLEMFLSLPLVLAAYHLTMGPQGRSLRAVRWSELALHLPFWVLTGTYVLLQLSFVQAGSSEAVVAQVRYGPGSHIFGNFYYLAYLIMPDVHYGVLTAWFGPTAVAVVRWLTRALAVAFNGLALYGFWKGSPLVRFAIVFIYLSFLPYTLWEGGFSGAIRYRYLPAIGFALLLALFLVRLYDSLSKRRTRDRGNGSFPFHLAVPAVVAFLLIINLIVVQIWVRRHLENSAVRRAFVNEFTADYGDVDPGTLVFIEVPAAKYSDLGEACTLLFEHEVHCKSIWAGNVSPLDVIDDDEHQSVYWLRMTHQGLQQIFPLVQQTELK